MRVLLIEDEKPLSAAIQKVLAREQIVADAACTGPDGLDDALTGGYDAIVLDVMLPGMDGFSVLARLRREGVATPVLMLTARGGWRIASGGWRAARTTICPSPSRCPS